MSYESGGYCTGEYNEDCSDSGLAKISLLNIVDDPVAHGHQTQNVINIGFIILLAAYL